LEETLQGNKIERLIISYENFGATARLTETFLPLVYVDNVEIH
jgi:hypothetical protein